ncbi:MAG: hypothetical protein PHO29_09625 [Acetobacterium sp.]|nr:hypothetical protein [Acetobacterium sp.]
MIFDKKDQDQKKKQKPLCQICHQNPATTTMPGPLGPVQVCKSCKKNVRI